MNLALVVHDFDPKVGHGRYCYELARRLVPEHSITVYANRFAVDAQPGWTYVRVPAWRRVSLASVFTFLLAAEPRVRRGAHRIVHAQGLTCWRCEVITAHICNVARYRVSPPPHWRARIFPLLVNPLEARFYRQRHARHLVAISRRVADEIRDCYAWRKPVTVIHHGVDTDQFRPARDPEERRSCRERFRLAERDWVWLFVGEAIKGLREAIAQLPHFPAARLLAVTRSAREPYEAQARNLGVADRFLFWGPEREVPLAYRAADVFVYPSTYDTFGMVVSEAMASGVPSIVGKNIGAAEIVEHGANGFVVDPARPAELHGVLSRLRDEPDLAGRLGAAGRATARTQTWDACAAATAEVYRQVVSSPSLPTR